MRKTLAALVILSAFFGYNASAAEPLVIEAVPRVMVMPFTPIGDPGTYGWVGTGIQQSLQTEVNRPGTLAWSISSVAPSTQPTVGAPDPVGDAATAGASVVVYGQYQIAGDDIRATGQMVEISSGRVLAALKATGPIHDIFKVEDTLGSQLQTGLPQPAQTVADNRPRPSPQSDSSVIYYGNGPVAQPIVYSYPTQVSYAVPYPVYTSYGYGTYCPPVSDGFVFYGNFGRGGFFNPGFGGPRFVSSPHYGLTYPVRSNRGFGVVGFSGPVGGFGGHSGFGFGNHMSFGDGRR